MHTTVVEIFNGAKEGNETGVRHANTIVEEYNKANPSKKVTLNQMIDVTILLSMVELHLNIGQYKNLLQKHGKSIITKGQKGLAKRSKKR